MRSFHSHIPAVLLLASLSASPVFADATTWNRVDFWAGEYPEGFTLKQDVTVKIRKELDQKAPRDVACTLKKGETYHPWNDTRVKSSGLEFVTIVRKVKYALTSPLKLTLLNEKTEKSEEISFEEGDEWTYLTYYAEGNFRMSYKGVIYTAEQDLFEVSRETGVFGANSNHESIEWMQLTCANGARGWLMYLDVFKRPEFRKPEFPEYGKAVDAK